jgi:hypothetical protein
MSIPILTDRAALRQHRARATPRGGFLHQLAAAEIKERLAEVNRTFTAPALVAGLPQFWADLLPWTAVSADSETLALVPGAHDLAVHALALHWANDPVGQIIQCRQALRPDGLFLGVAFGGRTLAELRACLAEAEAEVTGGLSPRVAPMAEIRDLGALLQRAGLALPVADSLVQTVTYRDLAALMQDLRAMGETNALAQRLRRPTRAALFRRAAEIYAASYARDGRIEATFELIFLAGWAPHPDQQQPLRPGSARVRLAEALNTAERKPGDG